MAVARRTSQNVRKQYFQTKQSRKTENIWRDVVRLSRCNAFAIARFLQGGPKKPDHFWKYVTPVYNDVGRRSIYQNVQLSIRSKMDMLNVAIFKYSLHMFRETIAHRKCAHIQKLYTFKKCSGFLAHPVHYGAVVKHQPERKTGCSAVFAVASIKALRFIISDHGPQWA